MSRISESTGGTGQQGGGGKGVAEGLRDVGGQVGDMAREQYEHLRESAQDYFEQGRAKAEEWTGNVESYVQEQPMKALLIAGGIGLLLGFLWRR